MSLPGPLHCRARPALPHRVTCPQWSDTGRVALGTKPLAQDTLLCLVPPIRSGLRPGGRHSSACRSYFIAVVLPAGGGRTPRPGIRVARAPDDGLAGSRLPLLRVRPSTPGPKEAKQALDPGWWHVHRQAPSRGRARAWLVCLGGVGTRRARLRMVRGPGGPAVLCCGETVAGLSRRKGTWALKAGCPQIPSPFTAL